MPNRSQHDTFYPLISGYAVGEPISKENLLKMCNYSQERIDQFMEDGYIEIVFEDANLIQYALTQSGKNLMYARFDE